jgi:hypothetical protein
VSRTPENQLRINTSTSVQEKFATDPAEEITSNWAEAGANVLLHAAVEKAGIDEMSVSTRAGGNFQGWF